MGGPIVVYGAGGHGRELASLIQALRAAGEGWELQGFLSDDPLDAGREVGGLPVLGGADWLRSHAGVSVGMGIGSPLARRQVVNRIDSLVKAFPPLVHPKATVFERAVVGRGVVIAAGALVSVDVELGEFAVLNILASASHDCRLGPFATLAPQVALAGNTVVGEGADMGTGVVCIPGVKVGAWSVVGAGAVVIRDVPDRCTAVGVPASVIRHHPPMEAH